MEDEEKIELNKIISELSSKLENSKRKILIVLN